MPIFPFYGTRQPELFEIERTAMDRAGLVIEALNRRLPTEGSIVDVGAGTGFTAVQLATQGRVIVAVEPAGGMVRPDIGISWVQGEAERMPFVDHAFDAAYATWAYFFTRGWDPQPGLDELNRIVRPGGALVIVDNLGGDEFSTFSKQDFSADPKRWEELGFACETIETHFEFDSMDDAVTLFALFFGQDKARNARRKVGFRVGLFSSTSAGSR